MVADDRFFAHSLPGRLEADWEPLEKHLERVAELAASFADAFGASEWGRLAGLWHDLGKYSEAFQRYIRRGSSDGEDEHTLDVAGRVDHSTAGAQYAASAGLLGRVLAYCIAGHHAGLPDAEGSGSALRARLEKHVERWQDSAPQALLDTSLPAAPALRSTGNQRRQAFAIGFFTRMLFSALVDADFLATEAFMDRDKAADRIGSQAGLDALLARLNLFLEAKEATAAHTPVNQVRRRVLNACRQKATLAPAFFSLNVPTGGGKTLSSLAFALEHARRHGMVRVIYAIPFTSIIEQTADVFRTALADMADEVIEHHSNLEPDDPMRQTEQSRLAAENFDAPLIVTTNVQLFESMFASRTSRCRKLHRLAKSVVVLDEAQTLPVNLLAPTLTALDELVRNYGATVVLCTATQPAIEQRPGFPIGIDNVTPIIDDPLSLHKELRRVNVSNLGSIGDIDLAARIRAEPRVLCIANTRSHAADLHELLDDPESFHLSANMCAAHRSDTLGAIRDRMLDRGHPPCRVISTQVVEAGVDLDFPIVYRETAGLDSIAQAAGRCNREGSLVASDGSSILGRVLVFDSHEGERRPPVFVRRAIDDYREVAPDYRDDLLSPRAVEAYFRLHYWQRGGDGGRGWDAGRNGESVMGCFGEDPLHHQFRQAADRYQLIEDVQVPIIVPYEAAGEKLIAELCRMPDDPDPAHLRRFDRTAQRYVVGVWPYMLQKLLANYVILERHGRYCLANPKAYDYRLGLLLEVAGLGADLLTQ